MNSHPLHSITVQKICKNCEKKKAKLEGTMSRLKLMIKELTVSVSRLKKEEQTAGGEESPVTEVALQHPTFLSKKNNK